MREGIACYVWSNIKPRPEAGNISLPRSGEALERYIKTMRKTDKAKELLIV